MSSRQPIIRRIRPGERAQVAPQRPLAAPSAHETSPASHIAAYGHILTALTAVAGGARSYGDVASRCGWTIQRAGAVLLACERGGFLPTDTDGNLLFVLRDSARLLVEDALATEQMQEQQRAYTPPSESVRSWLRSAGSGGAK